MEKITFVTDDGGKEEFYVEEQTRINGVNYILVSAPPRKILLCRHHLFTNVIFSIQYSFVQFSCDSF